MDRTRAGVAVLGAGLAGVSTALELARRGTPVTLVDQDERPLNRASLRNEGKIHLGLIYANDPTLGTARLQLQGALCFRRLLARWIGTHADRLQRSTPFLYLVAEDSLLSLDQLATHYAALDKAYEEFLRADPTLDYLGERPDRLWSRCRTADVETFVRAQGLLGAFTTAEVAIDPAELSGLLRTAVAESPLVRFLPGRRVAGVDRTNGCVRVEGDGASGPWRLDADQVVNALWESRLAVDQSAGLAPASGWVHRLKYRVIARLPERLRGAPSVTMVLGRYGDVVIRPDGTAYLSWYPAGLKGWTHELAPPASWNAACRGEPDEAVASSIAQEVLRAIDAWYPGIGESEPLLVDAGVIVAYGRTDVDDASSALHDRSKVGVSSVDGYHSLDPGKLTTAPLFGALAAARVLGEGRT